MSAGPIPFDSLFDPGFLASLSHLSLEVQRVAAGGRFGERLSRDLGGGFEFRDFRAYSPGDDPRAIDWNIYRRLGRVFLRLYEEQQDLPLYLMPDVSPSMFHEPVPRALAALRCTLALATISLSHHDSTALFPFADQVEVRVKSMSGKASTMAFAEHLARLAPADGARTNLAASVRRMAEMHLRRGLLVIISDFFDPEGLEPLRNALRSVKHRMLFVQLVRPSDATPALDGDLRLRDCETGDVAEITITPHVLSRYHEAYAAFTQSLADLVKYYHGGLLRLDVEADLVEQLNTLFAAGRHEPMTFANLSGAWVLGGLAGLAALLYVLQQLRTRYRDVTVVTTMFWKQVVDEAPVRKLRERFRHPWAYALILLIAALVWIAIAEPEFTHAQDRTFYVLVLDGSAGMTAGTRYQQAVDQIERQAARLPRDQREVIWSGAEIRPLLAPGEHELLLTKRLEGLTPDAAPASIERTLRQITASRSNGTATSVVVFGDAPVRKQVVDLLPKTITVARAGAAAPLSGNAGITALGVSDAASGAWDQVDVFVSVQTTGDRPAGSAKDVSIDLDGHPVDGAAVSSSPVSDGQGFVIRDVPAQGGLLTVKLAASDSLPIDNIASVRLPVKPVVKVLLSDSLKGVLGPVLAADRGVALSADHPDVVIRRAGESMGLPGNAPALEFVSASTQPQAFLLTHPASFNATDVFSRAVDDIGLTQIDAMSLAQASGRAIEVSVASGTQWRFSVWNELLSEDYDFTRSRSFPLFVANAVRWLANAHAWYPSVAAGRALVTDVAGERPRVVAANGLILNPPGVDLVPAGAGTLNLDANAKPLAVSLLDPAATTGARDASMELANLSRMGFAPEIGLSTWLLLLAVALLGLEWHLYQQGRVP